MAKKQSDREDLRKDLERIVAYIGARANIIKANYPPKDQQVKEGLKFKVDEYTRFLNQLLQRIQETTTELTPELRDAIMDQTGYFLDFHPTAEYPEGPLRRTPIIYLGNIGEKRPVSLREARSLFLITRSDEQRKAGVSYPPHIQSEPVKVYTHNDVTWVDFKERLEYVDNEELAFLVGLGLDKYIRSRRENILQRMSPEELSQLRNKGTVNYKRIK